jgi:Fic family protein
MKKPRQAPSFVEILKKMSERSQAENGMDRLQSLLGRADEVQPDHYFHWDELRYSGLPTGVSAEEWWFLLKLQRQSLRQVMPLLEKSGAALNVVMIPKVLKTLHEIDLHAGGQIRMPEEVTNPETKDSYYVSSLIEEAITSSQLEGASTTRKVAKEMLQTGRAPRDRSERMILNNFLAMKRLGVLKHKPLTPELILEIHEIVTRDALDDPTAAGRFRRKDEEIGVYDHHSNALMHMPPPAEELEARINGLCDFANKTQPFVHPVIRSIILHFMIGYDHPFVDGNGRTARAMFYWSMLRHGYWLAEFISISQIVLKAPAQYARAFLYTETDESDLTYFILYHLKVIMRALTSLHDYIARKTAEIRALENELRGTAALNHRQRDLIRHAMRHPGKFYTVKGHQLSHNVSYESARTDLLDLAHRDLLEARREERGQGGRWVFVAQPNLVGRLAAMANHASGSGTLL